MRDRFIAILCDSNLYLRILSGLVLALVVGVVAFLGGIWWMALLVLLCIGSYWEWLYLCWREAESLRMRILLAVFGLWYIATAGCGFYILRNEFIILVFLILLVSVTDIAAYFGGRLLGGKKLCPGISPNKTYSGAICGLLGAVLIAVLIAALAIGDVLAIVDGAVMGAFVGLLAQSGDLLVSWLKRRAGVKDSGRVIPGHGGLLDRLDGYLAVGFVSFVIYYMLVYSGLV